MIRSRLRPSPLTGGLLVAALVAVTWSHLDAGRTQGPSATLVSTKSSAWRVLPELSGLASAGATVELWPAMGDPVRLVSTPGGHRVLVGERILGPADPEAVEGVWDSLRMATTVRAAAEDSDAALGNGGRIVVQLPDDGGTRTLVLGRPTADGAGIYGVVEGGAEGTAGLWVLEQEMSELVQQAPEAWLARRAVVAEPAEVLALVDDDLRVELGPDGLWRGQLRGSSPAILDRDAVRTRLARLLSARLDPLVDPGQDPGEPWVTIEGADGIDWALRRHGACEGRSDRILVDRGPGRWGCVDAALVAAWPMPGRPGEEPGALLDPHLLPHPYGRVLRIEQRSPEVRVLQRYGGGWRIEETIGDRQAQLSVDEPEVFRWYEALGDAEVTLVEGPAPGEGTAPDVELNLVTDSTATLRLRCWSEPSLTCQRDDGPALAVRESALRVAFDAESFAERRLTAVRSEDVRAIEILAGPAGPDVLRQSAHFDLGVWRLDAPIHPEGDAALDAMRLEGLLGALGGLRADAWVDDAADVAAVRRLRVERVPRRGQEPVLEVELLPDCVARIAGHRPARMSEGTCRTLGQDLLVEWPLQRIIDTARTLELTLGGRTTRLQRRGEVWAGPDGAPASEDNAWLDRMHERTSVGVRRGEPGGEPAWSLRVLPTQGTAFTLEGGADWVRFEGRDWFHRLSMDSGEFDEDSDEPGDAPAPPDGDEPDPETLESP